MIEDEITFDYNKTYFLVIIQDNEKIVFTANKVYFKKPVLTFLDKYKQQITLDIDNIRTKIIQVKEVKQ